jgi:hypothetical protein
MEEVRDGDNWKMDFLQSNSNCREIPTAHFIHVFYLFGLI